MLEHSAEHMRTHTPKIGVSSHLSLHSDFCRAPWLTPVTAMTPTRSVRRSMGDGAAAMVKAMA